MPDQVEKLQALIGLRSPVEQRALDQILEELAASDGVSSPTLQQLWEAVYIRNPVDIVTFIESPEYLNKQNQVWPKILADLEELFGEDRYYLAILRGAIGYGKTTLADIGIAYQIYQLSCLKDPSRAYGLMSGSTVATICVSVNLIQAKRVVFKRLKQLLDDSPYFREEFPYEKSVTSELRFPREFGLHQWPRQSRTSLGKTWFRGPSTSQILCQSSSTQSLPKVEVESTTTPRSCSMLSIAGESQGS